MKIQTLLLLLFASSTLSAVTHRALLIGIGDYPKEGGWGETSAENDLIHLQEALIFRGFLSSNITLLQSSQATRQGIITAFEELQQSIKPGDIVFIHFSGHGQQICDNNGDEIDYLDEAIVPYDSPIDFVPGVNEGEKLIRDDELNILTRRIRAAAGKKGQVVFVLDACHSGTGTRGVGIYRGTKKIMAPKGCILGNKKKCDSVDFDFNNTLVKKKLAPLGVFSASGAGDFNEETVDDEFKTVGSISYAFSKILTRNQDFISFAELFERVRSLMKLKVPRQVPQWEGDKNRILFSPLNYSVNAYALKSILEPTTIRVKAGLLSGLREGTIVSIKSIDKRKIISKGIVSKSFLTESIVTTSRPLKVAYDELLQVYIADNKSASANFGLTIRLKDKTYTREFKNKLADLPFFILKEEGSAELNLRDCRDDGGLQIEDAQGNIIATVDTYKKDNNVWENELSQILKNYQKAVLLKEYRIQEEQSKIKLDVSPIDCDELDEGYCFDFTIRNQSADTYYFSLIYISASNELTVLLPDLEEGYRMEDCILSAGSFYEPDFTISEEKITGSEVMKLLYSKEPIDISAIIQDKEKYELRGDSKDEQIRTVTHQIVINP